MLHATLKVWLQLIHKLVFSGIIFDIYTILLIESHSLKAYQESIELLRRGEFGLKVLY